tara:strand:- start:212 stop:508 length:297 start_codon:yes stop_codon:yes gene_type:complete
MTESSADDEGDILNLAECFKEAIERKDENYEELHSKYLEVYKLLMVSYTIFRMTDELFDNIIFEEDSMKSLRFNIEYGRSQISEFLDDSIEYNNNEIE